MTSTLPVSVIIPAYNAALYIEESLASVFAQAMPSIEIIVVDDGSTDATAELVQHAVPALGSSIRLIRQTNQGIGAARNAGVAAASQPFIAFLDADDLWPAARLEKMYRHLAQYPECSAVFGHTEQFFSPDVSAELAQRLLLPPSGPAHLAGAMLLRRAALDRCGLFDPSYRVGEFVDWFARFLDAGLQHVMLDEPVLRRRVHGRNTVLQRQDARQDYLAAVRKALLRRREKNLDAGETLLGDDE